jgi:hypothetical protein
MIALEVTLSDGAKLRIEVSESEEDGAPIVQIDTDVEANTHDHVRVYLNDACARWSMAERLGLVRP